MLTFGDIFSGGGGASVGARLAGYDLAFAVEREPEIAAVYRRNLGEHVRRDDVLALDPATLPPVDVLWASPPCQGVSVARSKKLPPHTDAEAGRAVIAYVRALRPRALVLENVPPYADTPTFRAICAALAGMRYYTHWEVVNAASFGVPQTRRRLILRALRDTLVPPLPAPVPWVGWYAAIEDLLLTLPESRFADWQLRRLGWLTDATLVHPTANNDRFPAVSGEAPAFTVTCTNGMPRAFLVHNQISQAADAPMLREDGEPAPNVTTHSGGRVRAWLQMTSNTQIAHPTGTGVLQPEQPANTVTSDSTAARAWLDRGRVVSMTPRALARFQSFPDWYELPASRGLACRVVGNAAPPLLAQRLLEGIAAVLDAREERSA